MRRADGFPYTVFTPFKRSWLAHPLPEPSDLLPAPQRIPTPPGIHSLPLPEAQPPSEFSLERVKPCTV